jgi:hypothetical protein
MALKGCRLELRRGGHVRRAIEARARKAPRHETTLGDLDLRRLIAHGIGCGARRRRGSSLATAATTTTLLLSVRFTTGRAAPIPPSKLRELETSGLGSTASRAVLLAAVAGPTDRKLGAAATAPLEADGIDASGTRAFALRRAPGPQDQLEVPGCAGHHRNDQIELDADVQRSA